MRGSPVPIEGLLCELGESPVWDPYSQRLWLVDVPRSMVYAVDPHVGVARRVRVHKQLTALVPRAAGGWLGVHGRTVAALDITSGQLQALARIAGPRDLELNDAVCGRDGRLYVGSVDRTGARRGTLYALNTSLRTEVIAKGVGASNGVDTSPDGERVYHADTFASTVTTYPSGVVFHVDRPDGLAVDAEGCIWVALWGGGEVRRYEPDGELKDVVVIPTPFVTNVAFGGIDLDTLFVTTAKMSGSGLAGSVFTLRPGVLGLPPPAFAG